MNVLTCAFCGEQYPEGTPVAKHELLTKHIWQCQEHPAAKAARAMAKTLRFYANEQSYRPNPCRCSPKCGNAQPDIISDGGNKAREVLDEFPIPEE